MVEWLRLWDAGRKARGYVPVQGLVPKPVETSKQEPGGVLKGWIWSD